MRTIQSASTATALVLALAACSGGSSGSGGGAFYIETCSLGCSSGSGGTPVACQFNVTPLNQEIAVYFSEPVAPSSVISATFQLVDVLSGSSPTGIRYVDPQNPRKVVFRPTIQFLTDGTISFGFEPDRTYRITVPGTAQGAGPYINSTGGRANESRLRCDIRTTSTIVDLRPGPPRVSVFVKQADLDTPDLDDFVPNVPGEDAVDVWLGSDVRMEFDDLMNPATLADPITGDSTFVRVEVDLDGLLTTTGDRTTLTGNYAIALDQINLRTTLTFTSDTGLPSSGDPMRSPSGEPRRIVVVLPPDLQDVSGAPLENAGTVAFTTEFQPSPPVVLPDPDGENFTDTANLDAPRSGAAWGGGKLTRGFSGGRGRLGDLRIGTGETVVLDTDMTSFPLPGEVHDLLTNADPGTDYVATNPATWPTITVTDGVFEFTTLVIDPGGVLRIVGSRPARVLVRGHCNIQGTLDISGATPNPHDSSSPPPGPPGAGGLPGEGGPNGGSGGEGATRFDSGGTNLTSQGGVDVPDADYMPVGARGQGIARMANDGAGFGSINNPTVPPTSTTLQPAFSGTLFFSNEFDVCTVAQVARTGGGGAYATDGTEGVPMTSPPNAINGTPNIPPPSMGDGTAGSSADAGLEPPGAPIIRRQLAGADLRGGSGGGGGGTNAFSTGSSGAFGNCQGTSQIIQGYLDHSGCGGGGGGGALQLLTGGSLFSLSGVIDASGGDGGSALPALPGDDTVTELRPKRATPGGGGSGGGVRVQALNLSDASFATGSPPRISVAGGLGGTNTTNSSGGRGGAGLVRLEGFTTQPTTSVMAGLIAPTDPGIVGTDAINILSIGNFAMPRNRPESYSGAVSCWMKPEGSFFQILFAPDDPLATEPVERFGWNMDVLYAGQTYSFRDPLDSPFPGVSIEQQFTSDFEEGGMGGAYFVVRFQGARALGALGDPCNVNFGTQVVPGSVTPWVRHPAELNAFNPQPNMVRFCVVFDLTRAFPGQPGQPVEGVTNLYVSTQPD